MIRYPITRKALLEKLEAASPGWAAKARRNPRKGIWNQVRDVYTRLQYGKCAYCERPLSDPDLVKAGHGRPVDHFRPKSLYPRLAHEPFNYAVACVDCNSALKTFNFPIEGARQATETDLKKLKAEKPLLIYPIGAVDEDPESLITFHGYIAMAAAKRTGYRFRRAQMTLKTFQTGPGETNTRREILRERALAICRIWHTRRLSLADSSHPDQPHANCCRSFVRLCQSSPADAKALYALADDLLRPKVKVKPKPKA